MADVPLTSEAVVRFLGLPESESEFHPSLSPLLAGLSGCLKANLNERRPRVVQRQLWHPRGVAPYLRQGRDRPETYERTVNTQPLWYRLAIRLLAKQGLADYRLPPHEDDALKGLTPPAAARWAQALCKRHEDSGSTGQLAEKPRPGSKALAQLCSGSFSECQDPNPMKCAKPCSICLFNKKLFDGIYFRSPEADRRMEIKCWFLSETPVFSRRRRAITNTHSTGSQLRGAAFQQS